MRKSRISVVSGRDDLGKEFVDVSYGDLKLSIAFESGSCTGPDWMYVKFDRDLLHQLTIDPEFVGIEIAEMVE